MIQLDMRYIHEDALRMSGIGVMVNLYSQHPKETNENRKKAAEILDRWIRPVFRLSDSYRDYDDEIEDDYYHSSSSHRFVLILYFFLINHKIINEKK